MAQLQASTGRSAILKTLKAIHTPGHIIPITELEKVNLSKPTGNGTGNRNPYNRICASTVFYGNRNTRPRFYPVGGLVETHEYNEKHEDPNVCEWDDFQHPVFEPAFLDSFYTAHPELCSKSKGVVGVYVHHTIEDLKAVPNARPIRTDIKREMKTRPCANCGFPR
jgi:hypothetical protein